MTLHPPRAPRFLRSKILQGTRGRPAFRPPLPLPSCRAVFSRRFHHSLPQPHCDSPVLDSWTHREARPPEENAQHGPPGPPGLTRTQSEMLRHLSAALAFPSVFTLKIISSAFLAFPRSPGAGSAPVLSVYFHFSFFPSLGRPGTVRSLYDWVTLHISPHNVALEHEARKSQARSAYPGRGFSTGSAARRIQSILKAESRPARGPPGAAQRAVSPRKRAAGPCSVPGWMQTPPPGGPSHLRRLPKQWFSRPALAIRAAKVSPPRRCCSRNMCVTLGTDAALRAVLLLFFLLNLRRVGVQC